MLAPEFDGSPEFRRENSRTENIILNTDTLRQTPASLNTATKQTPQEPTPFENSFLQLGSENQRRQYRPEKQCPLAGAPQNTALKTVALNWMGHKSIRA